MKILRATNRRGEPDDSGCRLTFRERWSLAASLSWLRFKEYLAFDSLLFKRTLSVSAYLAACVLYDVRQVRAGYLLLSKLHRANLSALANRKAEQLARDAAEHARRGSDHRILSLYREHVERFAPTPRTARFFEDPARLLGSLAMVLKSPAGNEKGVVLLQYSYSFPLFVRRFDVEKVASLYHIVLEPDWSGYCDLNILSYCRFSFPVFVQAFEPRDASFISRLHSNLVVVPTSSNWWVDHRLFRPVRDTRKDFDVVMVAGWGRYKRHHRFFQALSRLRRAGHQLRVLLLGYPIDMTRAEIVRQAAHYGVVDQLELHESVPYERVNELVNRARVNVIWSRREGVNRAIIEGMFAGVPCIVRKGFNYGYPYPYINAQTGCFASEEDLPRVLLRVIERHDRFMPREWVATEMSCQRATQILDEVIGLTATGESWTGGLAVKVNKLHKMEYWEPNDHDRFRRDYAYLRSTIRP